MLVITTAFNTLVNATTRKKSINEKKNWGREIKLLMMNLLGCLENLQKDCCKRSANR